MREFTIVAENVVLDNVVLDNVSVLQVAGEAQRIMQTKY